MQASAIFLLMGGDGQDMFDYVKKANRQLSIKEAIKQYIPSLHDVADKGLRPDKPTFVPQGINEVTGATIYGAGSTPVTRAPLSIQKYIIGQKGSFARGNGVVLKPTIEDSVIYKRVYDNWTANKTDFDLKEFAVRQMAETQVAVIFYGEKGKESLDDFKFRYKIVSPLKGDILYPYFDEDTDDLIAFGREYTRGKENRYDLYLMNEQGFCEIWRYINEKPLQTSVILPDGQEGQTHNRTVTQYTKLPIVFWEQESGECEDTDAIITELETGFSDYLTQLGYTADPILFGKGKAMNLPAKGVAGKFIETDDPAGDLKYLTPDNATEARDLQFRMLQKYIFSLNRSVLLDLDTLKGLGAVSGAALERYLIDVYMDGADRQMGSWGKGVQRMVNWLTSQWSLLENTTEKGLRIDVVFTKYSLQDDLERVTLALLANGNKPVVDLETSIGIAGLVDNVQSTMTKIKEEEAEVASSNIVNPPIPASA